MSEEYVLQITYQGVDDKGRTVMLNVRGCNADQFDASLKHAQPLINSLKPLPVKQFGGAGQAAKKQIVYLPDAPKCPKHAHPMNIREWTSPEGKVMHFWSCGEKGADGWCKEKIKPDPTPEQIAKWRELNGIEAPPPISIQQPQPHAQAEAPKPNGTTPPAEMNWRVAFEGLQLPDWKAKAFLNTAKSNYEAAYELATKAKA
jgi:hypothetical protein